MYFNIAQPLYDKGDEASPSIILAGGAVLVKMLITQSLEPHGIFQIWFKFCILIYI